MQVVFLGVDRNKGKGGVSSVLFEYEKIFPDAIFISSTTDGSLIKKLFYLFYSVLQLFILKLKFSNCIIHIHGSSYISFHRKFILFKICRLFGFKIIYHIHGAEFHKFYEKSSLNIKEKIKLFINNVDCLICLSEFWRDFFNSNFKPKKIYIIHNIVSKPKILKFDKGKLFSFLFLGYIDKRKGIWLLLETINLLKDKLENNFVFYIGGNGKVKQLEKLIIDSNLEKIVKYIGWVDNRKKIEYLNMVDAYILPSFDEGLPISVLEAMSYNLPIISTNVGGIPEVLINNVNGFLLEPGSKSDLLSSFNKIIDNPQKFKNLGKNNPDLISKHLPNSVKNQLSKIYSSLA